MCFIFGFDGTSDRPDPLHLTVYIPIAWAEIPVRIEQIYLDSPDSSLPQWYWPVTISWVSLLKQRVNLADAFPFIAAGRSLMILQHKLTSTSEWSEKTLRSKRVSALEAVVVHLKFRQSKTAEGSPKESIQVIRVSPNMTTFLYQALNTLAASQTIIQSLFPAVVPIMGWCCMSPWHYCQTAVSGQEGTPCPSDSTKWNSPPLQRNLASKSVYALLP